MDASFWYQALDARLGIAVRSTMRDRLKFKLYEARKATRDPDLDALSIICPAHEPDRLWIVRKHGPA